jgi:hypothetical protein
MRIAHGLELPLSRLRETSPTSLQRNEVRMLAVCGDLSTGTWVPRPHRAVLEVEIMSHPSYEYHEHDPEPGSGMTGFAAIKYTAIVIIVLAILAFLAWYVVPKF